MVGTEDYEEKTASEYSSFVELKFASDYGLDVLPLRFSDTWPPAPPGGPSHAYDKKGLAKAYIAKLVSPAVVFEDCRDLEPDEIANRIQRRLKD